MATCDCDEFRVTFEPAVTGSDGVVTRAAGGREAGSTFSLPMSTTVSLLVPFDETAP